MKKKNTLIAIIAIGTFSFCLFTGFQQTTEWVAPSSADTLKNPVKNDPKASEEGKKIYNKMCWNCHGLTGRGDGPAATNMKPKPADHSSVKVQSQTDGAIYWKIATGRGAMQPYSKVLSKLQRWQLVTYIRTLAAK